VPFTCILPTRSPDAKVCFQGDQLAAIFEVRSGRSGIIALFVFSVLAPWWRSQESDRTEAWSDRSCGYAQSIRSIALAVTKRAVFTDDDDDGQHVIALAHLLELKSICRVLTPSPQNYALYARDNDEKDGRPLRQLIKTSLKYK
jgi:hypothetical protein